MKILHLCLSAFYIDNYNYQENLLPYQNLRDGHDVRIIASTETYNNNRILSYSKPKKYINEYGVEVTRIPYRKILPHFVMKKIRSYSNLYKIIEEFKPDVILHHGVQSHSLLTLQKYKKKNPQVKLFLDNHADFNNSAKGFLSKYILHKIIYRYFVQRILPYIEKILCVNLESFDFLSSLYGVPNKFLEFYPLGGYIEEEHEYQNKRDKLRQVHNLNENNVLFVHAGKFNKNKKTLELLEVFTKTKDERFRLYLIGSFSSEINTKAQEYIENDQRIKYLGWKEPKELSNYLIACDMYLQPGTQSAIMQNAICKGCPVVLYPYKSHEVYLKKNGYFAKNKKELKDIFNKISKKPSLLIQMRVNSLEMAKKMLDYRKLAKRYYINEEKNDIK